MSTTVNYARYDNIAVLTLNNPPVNALGASTRYALRQGYRQALADGRIDAIVFAAKGKLFSGGADIAEFQAKLEDSSLRELFLEIERSTKPTIAAIQGLALGGALELALVCNYRVATPNAKLGLPEVNIGVIPGAGGTQRLPRLIGIDAALDIITSGKPVSASAAHELGLVDAVFPIETDFQVAALAFARGTLDKDVHPGARNVAFAGPPKDENALEDWKARIAKASRGLSAPQRALESVWNSMSLPIEKGLAREAVIFDECNRSSEGRALQHIFFAERKVAHVRGLPSSTRARDISKVAIIGAGTMGGGIAMNFLNAGLPVNIIDMNETSLERGLAAIRKNYEISASRGRLTQEEIEARLNLLDGTTGYQAIGDADLVIEAVFENMDVKKAVFIELDRFAKPGAILATNTSTLDVNDIAAVTQRPEDVVGLHFFSPANVMRLVEIVRGAVSSPDAIATALEMCKRIGKVGVVVGVCYGFVGNRMLEPYGREAHRLLLEGASPEVIDRALTQFGMSMGPLSMYDLAGNDIGALIRKQNRNAIAHDPSYCRIGDLLAEHGDYGQKSGKGFYVYEGRDKRANPDLPELIAREAKALGIQQRDISAPEILERCLYPLIDEGIRILEEGIAQRPGDIDIVWCNGYGFPKHRGGPMHLADEIGPAAIFRSLEGYRKSLGDYGATWFQPSTSLEKLASSGASLSSLFSNN